MKTESTSRQDVRRTAAAVEASRLPQVRLSGTDRLETFSDGVLSITITLLVAEIVRPEHAPGQLLDRLVEQWPSYIAFLASFFYTGVIWLNHRAVFARVRYCDRGLHLANLFLLLTSGLIPFPTAILSSSIQIGNDFDARIAVVLYAAIAGSMCLAWLILFHVLSIHPWLVEHHIGSEFFPKERLRAIIGIVCYTVAGVVGLSMPKLALVIFLALPVFYGVTSEGLTETRIRLQFGNGQREAAVKRGADRAG
ncbi:TMEM175 family protein [Bradyrhizobium sp. CIAT3101]|uniref:TMEM175 family protein n=1 Tax=Bradyrhizobium sp. CIAT3101 TaxID=439387 RepID=UPI0024B10C89|nr:TMEM175 family protein [Bradyrhizobium sp. CIAT3101]WFU82535.1 TMEM175 family protein [Bradyrhizobium sp. CIAT3101]